MALQRVGWENGTLVEPAKVLSDNTVQPAQYEGTTPLSADNLKKMENNTEKFVNEQVGDLNSLNTTDKSSLVSAINEVNSKDIYSTTETKIGTWIDGKDIYRKVIDLGAFQLINSLKNVTIPNTPIETLIKGNWIFKNSNKWYFDYTTPDNIQYINATTISVGGNENINCQQFYIILEYTKPMEN